MMISLAIIYLYILFLTLGIGVLFSLFLSKLGLINKDSINEISPDYLVLLGLVVLTTFLSFYCIFFPVNLVTNFILFGSVYLLIFLFKKTFIDLFSNCLTWIIINKKTVLVSLLVFLPLLFILILFSISPIQSFDTGLYHAQNIQWIESVKTPPGLVWIHRRFAFNSHFHVISALFTFSSLGLKNQNFESIVFYPLNSFIFLMFAFRSVYKISKALVIRDFFEAVLYCGLLLCSFCVFGAKAQSPMPDIGVALFIFYAFIIYLEKIEIDKDWTLYSIIFVLVIIILPTFKLSAGLIVLFLIPIALKKSPKKLWPVGILAALVVLPYFIRNIIISGYPLYSLPQIDLVNVDWKPPIENVVTDNNVVKAWARIPYRNFTEVLNLPFAEWFPVWWKSYGIELDNYILKLSLGSPLIMVLVFWIGRKTISKKMILIYAVLMINIIFWFISAPDPRFAWGFLYFNFAFTIGSFISLLRFRNAVYPVGLIILFFTYRSLIYLNPDWSALVNEKFITDHRWYPHQIPTASTQVFVEGTFELFVPMGDDGRCYNHRIPCTPEPLRRMRMRGESLGDGFLYDSTIP